MSADLHHEAQVPLGLLAYAGAAAAGRGLAFNPRLGMWHEVAVVAPVARWSEGPRWLLDLLSARSLAAKMLCGGAAVLLVGFLLGMLLNRVTEGRARNAKPTAASLAANVGPPTARAVVTPTRSEPGSAASAELPVMAHTSMVSGRNASQAATVAPAAALVPHALAPSGPLVSAHAGASPELVPTAVLQAARSSIEPSHGIAGHGLPRGPATRSAGSVRVPEAQGARAGAGPVRQPGSSRSASRRQASDAGEGTPNAAPPRRAQAPVPRRTARDDKKPDGPAAAGGSPGAESERGRASPRPEAAASPADFRLAPFGALTGRAGSAGRDVLVAIKDSSTVIVSNQRGMPTPFRLGEKLPSGAVLLSIHPRLESAETDRGVIRLE